MLLQLVSPAVAPVAFLVKWSPCLPWEKMRFLLPCISLTFQVRTMCWRSLYWISVKKNIKKAATYQWLNNLWNTAISSIFLCPQSNLLHLLDSTWQSPEPQDQKVSKQMTISLSLLLFKLFINFCKFRCSSLYLPCRLAVVWGTDLYQQEANFRPNFLHQSQQRPNIHQPKNCQTPFKNS